MMPRDVVSQRLRAHRLSAPAPTIADAASHMLATQSQEFWGGRWALAVRTRGRPGLTDVDAQFDSGELVRSWTMRGTVHVIPARDLDWVLSLTRERQLRAAAPRHRELGLGEGDFRTAEKVTRAALTGGNRLTRAQFFALLAAAGIAPTGQRGVHVLNALSVRGVVCQGPVVERVGGPPREQYLVLSDEWIAGAVQHAEPLTEFFVRYVTGHGPAGVRDFAWWSGLPLGEARRAAESAGDRVRVVGETASAKPEPVYVVAGDAPRRSAAASDVLALPPFEEFYIPYLDRSIACAPELLARVGPAKNGMVRPIILARGAVIGVWTQSFAVGRHDGDPIPELFAPEQATDAEVSAALERYRDFVTR